MVEGRRGNGEWEGRSDKSGAGRREEERGGEGPRRGEGRGEGGGGRKGGEREGEKGREEGKEKRRWRGEIGGE